MAKKSNIMGQNNFQTIFKPNTEERMGSLTRYDDLEYIKALNESEHKKEAYKLPIQVASSLTPEPAIWIVDDWLPTGELTIIAGAPGTCKTTLTCAIAAGVTIGSSYHLHEYFKFNGNADVIFINNEDNVQNSLLSKLISSEANLTRVHFINTRERKNGETPFSFENERDVNRILGLNRVLKNNIGLIVIDPVYFGVNGDPNNNHKARLAYENLPVIAKEIGCAILGVAHTVRNPINKSPLSRVAGPPALREVPRGIWITSKIANGPTLTGGTHVLVHAKNNLGKIDGGFEFCLQEDCFSESNAAQSPLKSGMKIAITKAKTGDAEDILAEADRSKPIKTMNKTKLAEEFLQTTLNDSPKLFIEIKELARQANIAMGTVQLAKTNLKIKTKKQDGDGRWIWFLPDEMPDKFSTIDVI